jgi:hypothetical protein
VPPIPDLMMGGLSMWLHGFSRCYWDRETRAMVYPSRWRAAIYKAWSHFAAFWHNRIHMGSMHLIPLRPIGLPHDGETFNDDTPTECAQRLFALRSQGYIVPQYAIDALLSEVLEDFEPVTT